MSELKIPYADISEIQLYVLGSSENEIDGHVEVKYQDTYRNKLPYPEGVYDLHMGTFSRDLICETCYYSKKLCTGHPGFIKLNYPVQSPLFLAKIKNWLKIICLDCGKTILPDEKLDSLLKLKKKLIFRKFIDMVPSNVKNIICPHCDFKNPHIVKDTTDNITLWKKYYDKDGKLESQEKLFNHEILNSFEKITEETVLRLGWPIQNHPSKLIWKTIRVSPNTMRPDKRNIGNSVNSNNDITVFLQNIIKINSKIPSNITEINEATAKDIHLLELHVFGMIKGFSEDKKLSLTNNSNKQLSSISKRWPGKFGRIRRNLMGRRANHAARSFITCDPSLRCNEVGLPILVCRNLQFPVHVQDYNYKQCMIWFMNARDRYPGCTKVFKKSTNSMHFVSGLKDNFDLESGDIIHRDLIDGDIINFNRAPSLEASSISSMIVKVMYHGNTIRINVTACPLFNADFDGDAMNVQIPRSSITRNEIELLASPGERFISYKSGNPIIGEDQDSIIGTAELTRTVTTMNKEHLMKMFSGIEVYPDFSSFEKDKIFTGRDSISMLFKETGILINFNRTAKYFDSAQAAYRKYNEEDIHVEIDRGELKSGILDKASIGKSSAGGIFHIIHNKYGADTAIEVSFQIQQICLNYLFNHGVTVSIRDLIVKPEYLSEINKTESALIAESVKISRDLNAGNIIAPLGKTITEYYEAMQLETLDPGDAFWPPLLKSIDPEINNFDKLIMYGSKGSSFNFKNVSTAVGQITIDGERAEEIFNRRALVYFPRYDMDPRARGYITDSYLSGVNVPGYIFHAQDTRHALISRSLKTSITGMYNRMAIKNLESLIIDNFRRVNKSGKIISLLYGSDGIDPRFMEKVTFPTMKTSVTDAQFAELYYSRDSSCQNLLDVEFADLKSDRDLFREIFLTRERVAGLMYQDAIPAPVNIKRIIEDVKYNLKSEEKKSLNVKSAITEINALCDTIIYCLLNETAESQKSAIPIHLQQATRMLKILIRSYLNIANLKRQNISNTQLSAIINDIKMTFSKGLVSYGASVGIIAAQSISEGLTQSVIDSHHSVGTGGGSKLKTMSRVKEILGAKSLEKSKSPTMTLFVLPEFEDNRERVREIANHIEMLNLEQFISNWKIFYEAYGSPAHPDFKHETSLIREFEKYNINANPPSDLVNWCIRFEMNKHNMFEKQMTMETIYNTLSEKFPDLFIVYNTDNSENMIIRIYIRSIFNKKASIALIHVRELILNELLPCIIRGIPGIISTFVNEGKKTSIDKKTNSVISKKIFFIATDGSNLSGVLMNPNIEKSSIRTDAIMEVYEHYGIAAARTKIIRELWDQVGAASYRHFTIYADEMTYTGNVTGIDRYGSTARETNFMLRISDSSPIKVIEESSVNMDKDGLKGVSSPIMVGRNPYIGDLYNNFSVDEEFIAENVENLDSIIEAL